LGVGFKQVQTTGGLKSKQRESRHLLGKDATRQGEKAHGPRNSLESKRKKGVHINHRESTEEEGRNPTALATH